MNDSRRGILRGIALFALSLGTVGGVGATETTVFSAQGLRCEYLLNPLGIDVQRDEVNVSFIVRNTGKRAGTEIAQVYVSLPDVAGEPPKRLIGWARVELAPGESKQVSVPVNRDRLTVYDEASDSWKLVPGNYTVMAGGSSQDLPLHQPITLP